MDISKNQTPLESFMYALRAKETIRQYPKRLKIFFDCGLDANLTLEEQTNLFYKKSIENINWAYIYFKKFIEYQKGRVKNGDIRGTTIHNYYKVAKLFCKMNDIVVNCINKLQLSRKRIKMIYYEFGWLSCNNCTSYWFRKCSRFLILSKINMSKKILNGKDTLAIMFTCRSTMRYANSISCCRADRDFNSSTSYG